MLRYLLILFLSVRAVAQMPVFGLPEDDRSDLVGDPSRIVVHSELASEEDFDFVREDFNNLPYCRCADAHVSEAGVGLSAFKLIYGLSDGKSVQAQMTYGPYADFETCAKKLDELVRLGECPSGPIVR